MSDIDARDIEGHADLTPRPIRYQIEVWGASGHSTAESGVGTAAEVARKLRAEANLLEPCLTCRGHQWVCENHPNQPWDVDGDGASCCGGAGAPCRGCNPLAALDAEPSADTGQARETAKRGCQAEIWPHWANSWVTCGYAVRNGRCVKYGHEQDTDTNPGDRS